MAKGFYKIATSALKSVVYPTWSGTDTLTKVGEYSDSSYFYASGDGAPIPSSFIPVDLSSAEAVALRPQAHGSIAANVKTLDEAKADAKAQINNLQAIRQYNSYVFTLDDGVSHFTVPINGIQDFINMLGMQAVAVQMAMGSIPATPLPFRGREGVIYDLSDVEAIRLCAQTVSFIKDQYTWAWTYYADIDAATTKDQINQILINAASG